MEKQNVVKIVLKGSKKYIHQMNEIKKAMSEMRKEVEQLNESLEKTQKLLNALR